MFEAPAWLLSWFYGVTHSYGVSIAMIALVVMLIITPLTLKSTKGMLEMQRLAPEMRKLQQEHRNDRTKLNEEMMKLYQEHKVSPLSSCLPLVAQMPIFIIMFQLLQRLTYRPAGNTAPVAHAVLAAADQGRDELGFVPRYIAHTSDLFTSLVGDTEMRSFGLDLAKSPAEALGDGLGTGIIYALLVVVLGVLYFLQQRMVAARAAVSPTMSVTQQKVMQYLPVVFAIFQVFFMTALVIYYMAQAVLRIVQQGYITRRFYGHDESLGRQAQRAGDAARELAKQDGGGGGLFGQARRAPAAAGAAKSSGKNEERAGAAKGVAASNGGRPQPVVPTKRTTTAKGTTAPKNRPTASGRGPSGRPAKASANRPGGARKNAGKKRR